MKTIPEAQHYGDRAEAGRHLAQLLREQVSDPNLVVIALARGGVPVGCELARELGVPLDVIVVRKLGLPSRPEYAMGAIASGGTEILDRAVINQMGISELHVAAVADRALSELRRREAAYHLRQQLDLRRRTAVLVDDGMSTGATMRAAIRAAREREADRVIVALPVGDSNACDRIENEVDLLICPLRPDPFYAVSLWYRDFRPTTDEDVRRHLASMLRSDDPLESVR